MQAIKQQPNTDVEVDHYGGVVVTPDVMYTVVLYGRDVKGRCRVRPGPGACVMRRALTDEWSEDQLNTNEHL